MNFSYRPLHHNDFWGELPKEIKQSINEAKAELDKGKGILHEEVMANVRNQYLPNLVSRKASGEIR